MNKNKKFYSQPVAELLVVRFEQAFLTGSVNVGSSVTSFDLDDEEDW